MSRTNKALIQGLRNMEMGTTNEAADRIYELVAEVKRLRERLQVVADGSDSIGRHAAAGLGQSIPGEVPA